MRSLGTAFAHGRCAAGGCLSVPREERSVGPLSRGGGREGTTATVYLLLLFLRQACYYYLRIQEELDLFISIVII